MQTHNRIDRISADTPSSRGSELLFTKRHSTEPDTGRVQKNGLAPPSALESAIVLFLPAGAYSAIVQRAGGSTGAGLVEIYDLDWIGSAASNSDIYRPLDRLSALLVAPTSIIDRAWQRRSLR